MAALAAHTPTASASAAAAKIEPRRSGQGTEAGRAGKSPDSGLHDSAEDRRVRSRRGVSRDRRRPQAQLRVEDQQAQAFGQRPRRHRSALDHVPARVRGHRRARSSVDHRSVRLRHSRGRRIPRDGIFPLRRPQGAAAEPADCRRGHRLPQGNRAVAQGGSRGGHHPSRPQAAQRHAAGQRQRGADRLRPRAQPARRATAARAPACSVALLTI